MRLRDGLTPVAMSRVALLAPFAGLREVLAAVAEAGVIELESSGEEQGGEVVEAMRRLEQAQPGLRRGAAGLAPRQPDLAALERAGRWELLAGEAQLQAHAAAAIRRRRTAILAGWMPHAEVDRLSRRLAPLGGAVVVLPRPAWVQPPTMLPEPAGSTQFHTLVETYGTAPYRDVDPTPFAAASYVLMFGMMFGDVGGGLLLALLGVLTRVLPVKRLGWARRVWLIVVACGLAGAAFGALYGEFFGPTGLVRPLWLSPLQDPIRLLITGVLVGVGLLAVSYLLGTVNRWREGGPRAAVLTGAGLAGLLLFAGVWAALGGVLLHLTALLWAGLPVALAGLALLTLGLVLQAGPGPTGIVEAAVELFDALIRLVTNSISFARLAAFGMVHAAIAAVVWQVTASLWGHGVGSVLAAVIFVLGTALAFALELLVIGIQALRLEYYELFSKIFVGEGRRFQPWRLRILPPEEVA